MTRSVSGEERGSEVELTFDAIDHLEKTSLIAL